MIRIQTHTDAVEAMTGFLTERGAQGVSATQEGGDLHSTRVVLDAYFPPDDHLGDHALLTKNFLDSLQEFGLKIEPARVSVKVLEFEDWEQKWRSFFPPRLFGDKLLVTPSWEPVPENAPPAVVLLDPGMAFGTGSHESTQLVLEMMTELNIVGKRVADIGTGSGILTIAAVKLGAGYVRAVDIDERVIPIAKENLNVNGIVSGVTLSRGTLDKDVLGTFDVILMNILAKVILPSLPDLNERLKPDGIALLSGITNDEADEVQAALESGGFRVEKRLTRGDWSAFQAMRT